MGARIAANPGEAPFEGTAVEEFGEDFGDDRAKWSEVRLVVFGIGFDERAVVSLGTLPKGRIARVANAVGFQAAGGARIASLPSDTAYEENRPVLPPAVFGLVDYPGEYRAQPRREWVFDILQLLSGVDAPITRKRLVRVGSYGVDDPPCPSTPIAIVVTVWKNSLPIWKHGSGRRTETIARDLGIDGAAQHGPEAIGRSLLSRRSAVRASEYQTTGIGLQEGDTTRGVMAMQVSAGYFRTLRVVPILGGAFLPEEISPPC